MQNSVCQFPDNTLKYPTHKPWAHLKYKQVTPGLQDTGEFLKSFANILLGLIQRVADNMVY
jgi:hypothetical protein